MKNVNSKIIQTSIRALLTICFFFLLPQITLANETEKLYQTGCAACHNSGAAGAPKLSDKANWQVRLSERKLEGLYESALKGKGVMPPKGLCGKCTEEQIKQIVDYMLSQG